MECLLPASFIIRDSYEVICYKNMCNPFNLSTVVLHLTALILSWGLHVGSSGRNNHLFLLRALFCSTLYQNCLTLIPDVSWRCVFVPRFTHFLNMYSSLFSNPINTFCFINSIFNIWNIQYIII